MQIIDRRLPGRSNAVYTFDISRKRNLDSAAPDRLWRYLMAVGRNEEGVRYSGVNTNLVILFAYIISSFLAGISAILFAFYSNAIAPSSHGSFYELYAIAAAVLGGCSLRGGEGTILGIIVGAALLQVLQNLVNLLGIPSSLNYAVMGGVILISVIVDQVMNRNKG